MLSLRDGVTLGLQLPSSGQDGPPRSYCTSDSFLGLLELHRSRLRAPCLGAMRGLTVFVPGMTPHAHECFAIRRRDADGPQMPNRPC